MDQVLRSLAIELDGNSNTREELKISEIELNSDSEVELVNVSTPAKEQRKKRVRKKINFGNVGVIQGIKDNHGVSSEGEAKARQKQRNSGGR